MTENIISSAKTIEELEKYRCPKVMHESDWYLKCVDCQSKKGCSTGKRVVELLNNQTRPKVKTHIEEHNQLIAERKRAEAREDFKEALSHGYAADYLSKKRGITIKAANQRLYMWRENYPDIYEKYGNWKRPPKNMKLIQKAREFAEEAFSKENSLEYIIEKTGKSRRVSLNRLNSYISKYPDLAEKYDMENRIGNWLIYNKKRGEKNMANKEIKVDSKTDTDEVSVSDFLKEQEVVRTINCSKAEMHREPRVENKAGVPYSKLSKEDILLEAVKAKRQEILNTIKALEHDIAIEKEKLSTLTKTMAILTGDIFPENPV